MDPREDRFVIEAFDCHPDGSVKLNALMQYLQEAAARHAEQLGFGFADLERRDCFWVLANLRLEMTDTPHWADAVTVRTWPSGFTRLAATREFLGLDTDGRELFRAASEWMILDKNSSRPKNLQRLDLRLPPSGPKVLNTELSRLRPAAAYEAASTLYVPFSSLDFNGHVNNTEYVRWALDGWHSRRGQTPAIRSAQMTYLAEAFESEPIEICVATDGDLPVRLLERKGGPAGPTNVFLMEIEP